MKNREISVRLIVHLVFGIILVLVWLYFSAEWWSSVVGVLAVLFRVVPAVASFFAFGEQYHTETAQTTENGRKLIEDGFEYVCTHNETMIFRRLKCQD